MAVQQPEFFRWQVLALRPPDRYRRRDRRTDDTQLGCPNFDIARLHCGIPSLFRARFNYTSHQDYRLRADIAGGLDNLGGGPIGPEGNLDDTIADTEIEEDQPTQIPSAVQPTAESHLKAHMGFPERSAAVRSHRSCGHWLLRMLLVGVALRLVILPVSGQCSNIGDGPQGAGSRQVTLLEEHNALPNWPSRYGLTPEPRPANLPVCDHTSL